jgi:hypothetical protein
LKVIFHIGIDETDPYSPMAGDTEDSAQSAGSENKVFKTTDPAVEKAQRDAIQYPSGL